MTGIDICEEAILNARENARINGVGHAHFIAIKTKNYLKTIDFMPDVVIVDPPRSGLVPKALHRLILLKADYLIYVSCNAKTFLADLRVLVDGGYQVRFIQPVDMFAHTPHLETVCLLCRC